MQADTYFPETRRMLLFHGHLIITHFWPASTLLHGHLALATLSLLVNDPQILEDWCYADEVHLGKSFRAMDFGLERQRDVQRLLWILHIGSVSVCLSSSVKTVQTSAAPYPGKRNPIVVYLMSRVQRSHRSIVSLMLLQHSHCTFATIIFGPFARLFFNLTMRIRALFPKPTTTLGLVEQAFWRLPFFTEWIGASSFEVILAGPSRHSTTGTLASGTSGSRWFSLTLSHERTRRRIRRLSILHAYWYRDGNCNCLLKKTAR